MALELRRKSKIYLKSERVAIEDNSPLSEEFFGLSDFPKYFGEGKNSFRIRPQFGSLKPNTKIDIEIIDANGNPIYWEVPTYKDDDKSRLVSVWVYDISDRKYNTPDGPCEVIIVGTLPDDQKIRWSRRVDVVKNKKSVSDIVFKTKPTISVSSSIETFVNKSQSGNVLTRTLSSGSIKYIKSVYGDDVSLQSEDITTTTTTTLSGISASFTSQPLQEGDQIIRFDPADLDDNSNDYPDFYNDFEEGGDSRIYIYSTVQAFDYLGSNLRTALVDTFSADGLTLDSAYTIHANGAGATPTFQLIPQSGLGTLDDEFTTSSIQVTTVSESLVFNHEMLSGSIELDLSDVTLFPRLGGGQSQPTRVTASITEIISSDIIRISSEITASDNRSEGSIHTYEYSDGAFGGLVRYYSTGSDIITENQISFVNVDLTNVKPISGRIDSIITSIKSQGLSNSEYETIGNTKVKNNSTISYKVPVPTEQLKDPKTLRVQFVNSSGQISSTELIVENVIFEGGNVYIGGTQSIVTGSFHIGNAIGTGIEMAGHSSGYLKSVGYTGFTSASLGKGPGGFLLFSGSGNLTVGEDTYDGVGLDLVANSESYFRYTTQDGGNLDIRTDSFFIGSPDLQFISGADANIEISSSLFHLDPQNDSLVIGADATILASLTANEIRTPAQIGGVQSTRENASSSIDSDGFARFVSASIGGFDISDNQINSTNDLLILKSSGQITGSAVNLTGNINAEVGTFEDVEIIGQVVQSQSLFLIESWATSSAALSNQHFAGSGTTFSVGSEFSYGLLNWSSSYVDNGGSSTNISSTNLITKAYTQGGVYSDNKPPTFKQWWEFTGDYDDYPNHGNDSYRPIECVQFSTPNSTDEYSITCDSIQLPSDIVSTTSLRGIVLQTAVRFGGSTGFGGFYPIARVEILASNGTTVLAKQEKAVQNASEWLDFSIPVSSELGYYSSNQFNVRDEIRIRLTWTGPQSSGGGTVTYVRWGELRLLKLADSPGIAVSNITFRESGMSSGKNATEHQGDFVPARDNFFDLGTNTTGYQRRWDDVYATNGTIQTSDETEKTNISSSDLGLSFVNELRPVSYKWIGKTRTHYGLIAQEVSSSLDTFGKTTSDFAGITTGSLMGLRYNELISPMIKAIQELSDEVNQLKLQLSQSQG